MHTVQKTTVYNFTIPDQTCLSALDQNQNTTVIALLHYDLQIEMHGCQLLRCILSQSGFYCVFYLLPLKHAQCRAESPS